MTSNESAHEWLRARAILCEHHFHSDVPLIGSLIAWIRDRWNSVATKWYVRPLIQQQSEFNEVVVDRLAGMEARLQRLTELQTRLVLLHEQLVERETSLMQQHEHLVGLVAELRSQLQTRLHDHDAWLIAQDRDQSELVHDLAELGLCLVRWQRALPDLARYPANDSGADPAITPDGRDAQDELA
jgi:hypothetical protein